MGMGRYSWEKLGKYLDLYWGIDLDEVKSMVIEGIINGKSPATAKGMLRYYENKLADLINSIDDESNDVAG
jgi:hypothetical protein